MPRRLGMRRESCAVCDLPVFLAEKLVVNRRTYHRTCFRCARCHNQLTPGNYYETEDGDFCCETCPDEDTTPAVASPPSPTPACTTSTPLPTPRSLSDEEKSQNLHTDNSSRTAKMRLNFMSTHLESSGKLPDDSPPEILRAPSDSVDDSEDSVNPAPTEINKLTATNANLSDNNVKTVCQDTKETVGVDDDDDVVSQCPSIVRDRLKMFESRVDTSTRDNLDAPTSIDELANEPQPSADVPPATADVPPATVDVPPATADVPPATADVAPAIAEDFNLLEAGGVDLSAEGQYPHDMNPFSSDEEDDELDKEPEKPQKTSTNPFGSSEDDDDEEVPKPAARHHVADAEPVKRRLQAPQINLNPFWSEDEDDSEADQNPTPPVPKPRTIRRTPEGTLRPNLERSGFYASSSSIGSSSSTTTTPGGTYRKRKPAPPPPVPHERVSGVKSPQSSQGSPMKTTPRPRKSKPAPPPPLPTSLLAALSLDASWEDPKVSKNQLNKSKQSQLSPTPPDDTETFTYADKSTAGKWKRKKGPAPARPIPQRRKIKVMSLKDVKLELDEIEMQQQGLEKQGVRLEQLIRDRCENVDESDPRKDENMSVDVEELVLELFALVNEKNELFRRQAELMLLKRQQRLEEEHADIEYQIRCLMCQPEATKTDFDKQREEALIQRLVEIVERRSEIVECLEMDRKREVEEDKSINMHMGLYAAKSKGDLTRDYEDSPKSRKSKKLKIKDIIMDKHLKKIHKKDADKDIDEAEVKLKRQTKKKWF